MLTSHTGHALNLIHGQLGELFSLHNFRELVSACRGKEIRYVRRPLQGHTTGFAIALSDCDVVCVCSDAEEPLELMTDVHELCHLLLGHIPRISYEGIFEDFMEIPVEQLEVLYRNHEAVVCRGGNGTDSPFTEPMEYDAESLGTAVKSIVERFRDSKPRIARRLFGGQ